MPKERKELITIEMIRESTKSGTKLHLMYHAKSLSIKNDQPCEKLYFKINIVLKNFPMF